MAVAEGVVASVDSAAEVEGVVALAEAGN